MYRHITPGLSEAVDIELIQRLMADGAMAGATVLDCGCGPGNTAFRLATAGAAKVVAIDADPNMLRQVPDHPRIEKVQSSIAPGALSEICGEACADIVLFKRSLYQTHAAQILHDAWRTLKATGTLIVVLPHRDIVSYVFGDPPRLRPYSPYLLFNRLVSLAASRFWNHTYRVATESELVSMMEEAIPGSHPAPYLNSGLPFATVAASKAA
ncbi:MAG: class I SAM-dependent methyltransferase [Anaerolineales bacterium]